MTASRSWVRWVALAAVAAVSASSADGADSDRPRTALVLSGGGARGAAHVGVLQVLEELNVPVDCVVGTSMGSIIGGLYAAGWSAQEMETLITTIDWVDVFQDSPPRKQTSFRRKEDDFLPLFPLELGLGKKGLRAPSGLIAGQKLDFLLKSLTLRAVKAPDFDHLGLPFRAVAADLNDGSLVVLKEGSLANALRASMSIPGVFSPVEIDGRVLVDGGIVRNLPIDIGRELCGERIIAVDIGTPRRQIGDEQNVLSVMFQTFSVLNKRNVAASRGEITEADLLVVPELGDISAASFQRLEEAVEVGRQAGRAAAAELAEFAVPAPVYERLRDQRRSRQQAWGLENLRIVEVTVRGHQRVDPRQITRRLRSRPGLDIDLEGLRSDLGRVYQMGDFVHVDFQLVPVDDGVRLVIEVEEKGWGPGFLRTGLRLESNLSGDSGFQALAVFRRTQLNRFGAEWKTVLRVGETSELETELFQPFDYRGFTFFAPFVRVQRDEIFSFDDELGRVEFTRSAAGVDFGFQLGNYAELRLGAEIGSLQIDTSGVANIGDVDLGGFALEFVIDRLESVNFPRDGYLGRIAYYRSDSSLGADEEYQSLETQVVGAKSWGANTLVATARYGSELSSELPAYAELSLGGFFNLSGLSPNSLTGDALALAGLGYYRRLGNQLYLGGLLEAGNVWQDPSDFQTDDLVFSGMFFIGRETFVGPMYLGYAQTDGGEDAVYFFLGRTLN